MVIIQIPIYQQLICILQHLMVLIGGFFYPISACMKSIARQISNSLFHLIS